jgi:hypothetical protein
MPQAAAVQSYNRSVNVMTMPDRIRRLPVSPKGFPVPWFVVWFKDGKPCHDGEGEPDFRVTDPRKIKKCVDNHLCWTCGTAMGVHKAFVIGPMCAINRVISEPPSHRDCAIWAACNCPFLANPAMRRNEKGTHDANGKLIGGLQEPAGYGLRRNPGAVCVWMTKGYKLFHPEHGQPGVLFSIGRPSEVMWFAEGRRATHDEVMASIDSGFPLLVDIAQQQGTEALAALHVQREVAMALVPD